MTTLKIVTALDKRYLAEVSTLTLPLKKTLSAKDRIAVDSVICNGRPVVRGTRITVQTVVEFLAAGDFH